MMVVPDHMETTLMIQSELLADVMKKYGINKWDSLKEQEY